MIEVILSLIIFIIGFIFGAFVPLIIKKYTDIFTATKLQNTSEIESDIQNINTKNDINNVTPDIIAEWQTGEVVGGENNE